MRSLFDYHPRVLGIIGILMICLLIRGNAEKTSTFGRSRRDVHENTNWQFANYTAKMITNESCYVCMILPTAASKHTMIPMKSNGSELKAIAQYCRNSYCMWKQDAYRVQNGTHLSLVINSPASLWCEAGGPGRTDLTGTTICLRTLMRVTKRTFKVNQTRVNTFVAQPPHKLNYTHCFVGTGNIPLGNIASRRCTHLYYPYSDDGTCPQAECSLIHPSDTGTLLRADDWYWVCGKNVYLALPRNWGGVCTLARFRYPGVVIAHSHSPIKRPKREVSYNDFPPPEHKLKPKLSKFFDSFFPQYGMTQVWNQLEVTHYRLATYINSTNRATEGIKQELAALRLTATQNRMALDILLAKEGGVCALIGDQCCTFIPSNDDDHGSISDALHDMHKVANQMKRDEHGDNSWGLWYTLFGQWTPYLSMIIPVIVELLLLCLFGPCIYKCIHYIIMSNLTTKQLVKLDDIDDDPEWSPPFSDDYFTEFAQTDPETDKGEYGQ
ncbi:uncharacterized protein LOC125141298 [Tachysurus fulvidraco]|uniref:uncharacterized protein LOC125141298 n=1 Tax=Tachysurus fulvidraco TaxID=1234273 RepID=UPI001FF024F3|nr:uncharacterized protein LOC125141298 [Tachysurus fulvidraco]XP_047670271.1 uncharacterized protein LOC125141298 [Tachysurus fulvidraco]XP_047670272.1 uncharacterized protein LOC125141298 [Tachysurus fulvidraco]